MHCNSNFKWDGKKYGEKAGAATPLASFQG